MSFNSSRSAGLTVLAGLMFVILGGSRVSAGLIPGFPIAPSNPDLYSAISSVSYNSATDTFSVTGIPQNLILPDLSEFNDFLSTNPTPAFSITAEITSAGAIGGAGGSLSIIAKSPSLGNNNTPLLQGTLEQFGFSQLNSNSGRFEFIFGSLTGFLAPYYTNGKAYTLLTAVDVTTAFDGTFLGGNGFAFGGARLNVDTSGVPVPEPAGATLIGLALAALLAVGRIRRR
jgi:hypothetical protein